MAIRQEIFAEQEFWANSDRRIPERQYDIYVIQYGLWKMDALTLKRERVCYFIIIEVLVHK